MWHRLTIAAEAILIKMIEGRRVANATEAKGQEAIKPGRMVP
jgi:hypothetical protein